MMGARQRSAGAVDSTSRGARGVASVDGVSARLNHGAVRPPQTGRNIMAKKTKKTGSKGVSKKSETQRKAEKEIVDAAGAATGTSEGSLPLPQKTDEGGSEEKTEEKSTGDGGGKAQKAEAEGKGKKKEKAESGEKPAFLTHLHDYDIGQPKPNLWEEAEELKLPGGGEVTVTLYFGQFGDAKNLDDKGEEISFERKADRTKWIAAQRDAWRRTQGGTRLRQKCRGRLRAVISKTKYIAVHQGTVITEEQVKILARAEALLEEVYAGINDKGILVDPKTGDVLDHELNRIAQDAAAKAS